MDSWGGIDFHQRWHLLCALPSHCLNHLTGPSHLNWIRCQTLRRWADPSLLLLCEFEWTDINSYGVKSHSDSCPVVICLSHFMQRSDYKIFFVCRNVHCVRLGDNRVRNFCRVADERQDRLRVAPWSIIICSSQCAWHHKWLLLLLTSCRGR